MNPQTCKEYELFQLNPREANSQIIWNHLSICPTCHAQFIEDEGVSRAILAKHEFAEDFPLIHENLLNFSISTFQQNTNIFKLSNHYLNPIDIDGYCIIEMIGKGGTSEVWLAKQNGTRRLVALKLLQDFNLNQKSRLQNECKILASITHPYLLQIYDSGMVNNRLWLALEYCPGGSLSQKLDHIWDPKSASKLIMQVALAAQVVHEKGIVHRDIKPANILIGTDDLPRLADFDLARNPQATQDLTQTGQILGTPAYIAPEQVKGMRVDYRADIHALGAVLYHLLTGRAPFRADSTYEALLLAAHTNPIAPAKIRADLSKDLDQICQKCLSKNPDDRYNSAKDLANDLDRYLQGKPVKARPLSTPMNILRWAQRNKALAGTGIFGLVSLLLVTVVSIIAAVQATAFASAEVKLNNDLKESNLKALENAKLAKLEADRAIENEKRALSELYSNKISQAHMLFENYNPKMANDLLDQCPFQLRRWEHDYIYTLLHGNNYDLQGHSNWVLCCAISPDGTLGASGGYDRHVKTWDLAKGKVQVDYRGHSGSVFCVAFSPDNRLVASGGEGGAVHLWDSAQGKNLAVFDCGKTSVHGLAFFPKNKQLAAVTSAGDLFIWNYLDKILTSKIKVDTKTIFSISISNDEKLVACGGDGCKVFLLSGDNWKEIKEFFNKYPINSIDVSSDGNLIATGNHDEKTPITVWDVPTGQVKNQLRGHRSGVPYVNFCNNDKCILSVGMDRKIIKWDISDGSILQEWKGSKELNTSGSFDPIRGLLLTGGSDHMLKIWNLKNPNMPTFLNPGNNNYLRCIREIPFGEMVASFSQKGDILFFNKHDLTLKKTIKTVGSPILSVYVALDGSCILTGNENRQIQIFDVRTGKTLSNFIGHEASVSSVLFDQASTNVISSGLDGTIRFWDRNSSQCIKIWKNPNGRIKSLVKVKSPQGNKFLIGDDSPTIHLWDPVTEKIEWDYSVSGSVRTMESSPDGRLLIVATENRDIFSIDLEGKEGVVSFVKNLHTETQSISFSPDGFRFVTSDSDWKVRVWDTETRKIILELGDHTDEVLCSRFSIDGKTLFSCGKDRTLRAFHSYIQDPFWKKDGLVQNWNIKEKLNPNQLSDFWNQNDLGAKIARTEIDVKKDGFSSKDGKESFQKDLYAPDLLATDILKEIKTDKKWEIQWKQNEPVLINLSIFSDFEKRRGTDLKNWIHKSSP